MFRSRGLDAEEAADLAQETVARTLLHLNRHGVRQPDLGPLMGRIARNLVAERARSRRPNLVALSGAEAVDDPTQDPHEHVARHERQVAVRRALGELNGRHREALLLSMRGSAPAEIARKLGVERNAADALLHRARRRLAERLADSRERLAGFIGVLSLRVRSAGRRASDAASGLHPMSVSTSQTVGTLITAAVIGAVSLSSPQVTGGTDEGVAPPAAPDAITRTGAPAPGDPAEDGSQVLGGPEAGDETGPVSSSADVRDHRVGAGAVAPNPATGEDEELELEVWHEREEEDRGVMGPLLDRGTDEACAILATPCDGGGE